MAGVEPLIDASALNPRADALRRVDLALGGLASNGQRDYEPKVRRSRTSG
jgi:hypothetical protein